MSNTIGHVNLYNIYGKCISGSTQPHTTQKIPLPSHLLHSGELGGPDACIDSIAASVYFNQPEVIAAAHVKKPPYRWSICGNQIKYTSTRKNLPRDTYPALVRRLRVVIYNGDWDACVPYTDGEAWTAGMGFSETSPWHPWLFEKDTQVAGYACVKRSSNNKACVLLLLLI